MILLWIVIICVFIFMCFKLMKLRFGICRCSQHLIGKVAIVTGSNTGCGYETAKDFAERGAKVILACRNEQKGKEARDIIISSTGNKDVHYYKLDLSSFKSIREFVDKFKDNEKRLDILVNNAGDFDLEVIKTEDGLLLGMQVNYFGPFLLTNLLLPVLKESAPSKIVNVSSTAYKMGKVNFEDLNSEINGAMNKMKIYSNAKLCTILMTVELSRQLKDTRVTVNALCPGFVATNIVNKVRAKFWRYLLKFRTYLDAKDAWEGAQTQIYLSVSPEVKDVSGCYYTDCTERKLEKFAKDPEKAKKLWKITETIVKLK